ncbi:hypothetical protein [Sphaerisporangium sp. NPDC051011]|uniref:hypothetical protein n=1 Tax=Sphaerisporangium sp. NPDC051011 TaxID=3155792 RepID=UPI003409CAC9
MPRREEQAGLDAWRLRAEAAEAEVARLRAGESDAPKLPGVSRTPGQWLKLWNGLPATQRLHWVKRILQAVTAAQRCIEADHDSSVLRARAVAAQHRAVAVRLTRQLFGHDEHAPADHLEWVPLDILREAEDADDETSDQDQHDDDNKLISTVGPFRRLRCPACGRETLLAATLYALTIEGMDKIGGLAACTECHTSPYTEMNLP